MRNILSFLQVSFRMEFSSPTDTADTKAAFRKPSNDAANRKYRRRSPANGSSSSEGSPKRDRNSSPIISRSDPTKPSEHRSRRKDDGKDTDRDAARIQHGRDGDRHSDRQSSRGSHGYSRDEYISHDKHVNDGEKYSERVSSRSGRESRTSSHSEYGRRETDLGRPRDYLSSADKSVRDRYDISGHKSRDKEKVSSYHEHHRHRDQDPVSDRAGSGRRHTISNSEEIDGEKYKRDRDNREEKRDYHYRSSRDSRSDRVPAYEESRVHRSDLSREDGGHRLREGGRREPKEHDGQKLAKEGKRYDDWETNRNKDRYKDKADVANENQEKPAKKSRFSNWDKGIDDSEKVSAKQVQEAGGNVAQAHAYANDSEVASDLDAAKVAAMRAAELVNKNLVGVGYMSADQKKKLLWGNKKSAGTEESGSRWDAALVGDRDRQEKFQKLMGVKGELKVEQKPNNQDQAEKQRELQLDLEKQYTAGLRRRDGRTVGLGL